MGGLNNLKSFLGRWDSENHGGHGISCSLEQLKLSSTDIGAHFLISLDPFFKSPFRKLILTTCLSALIHYSPFSVSISMSSTKPTMATFVSVSRRPLEL